MHSSKIHPDRRGTTLVELLIVFGIIGLIMLFTAPAAARVYDRVQVRAARSALVNLYQGARVSARISNRTVVLRVTGNQVLVLRNSLVGPVKDTLSITDLQDRYGVLLSGPDSIRIDPRGLLETNLVVAAKYSLSRGSGADSVMLSSYGRITR